MGSNKPKPIKFVKSHQDLDISVSKPMVDYNPDDLIGRTFLLAPNQKGKIHRTSIKQKVIQVSQKLDEDQTKMAENINFLLDVGHRMGSGGTCRIFGVTVVNKWGTTPIPQSARTISQVRTRTTIQMLGTTTGTHKEGAA